MNLIYFRLFLILIGCLLVVCYGLVSSKVSENSLPSIKKIDENGNQHMQVLNDLPGPPNFSRRSLLGRIVTAGSASFLLTSWPLEHSIALTPDQAESSYDKYASTYDDLDGGAVASALGLDDARRALVGSRLVRGNVLEIGVGTGLNMDKYNLSNGNISSICFLDISEGMIQVAMQKLPSVFPPRNKRNFDIDFVRADATSQLLDVFGSNSLDTVIDTFSLCVLGNSGALQCLQQMRQVVKPRSEGGEKKSKKKSSRYEVEANPVRQQVEFSCWKTLVLIIPCLASTKILQQIWRLPLEDEDASTTKM